MLLYFMLCYFAILSITFSGARFLNGSFFNKIYIEFYMLIDYEHVLKFLKIQLANQINITAEGLKYY